MKKLLSILLLFVTFGALAQTYDTLPTGSKPYGNFYLGPDGNLVFGNAGLKFRVIGTKKRVDSLLALKADLSQLALYQTKALLQQDLSPSSTGYPSVNAVIGGLNTKANSGDLAAYQGKSEKGQSNGYAGLDGSGKVPLTQINDALLGAVNYRGTYNASTNSPTLPAAASSNKGYYYIVSTAGTQFGLTFRVGDWIISNGSAYGKVASSSDVESVNGKKGVVNVDLNDVLTAGNTSEQAMSVGAIIAGSASVTSAPTQPSHVVRQSDLSGYVNTTTDQTVGGNKTFSNNLATGGTLTVGSTSANNIHFDNSGSGYMSISARNGAGGQGMNWNAAEFYFNGRTNITGGELFHPSFNGNDFNINNDNTSTRLALQSGGVNKLEVTQNSVKVLTAPTESTDALRLGDVGAGKTIGANTMGNAATATSPQNTTNFKSALATSLQDVTSVGNSTTNLLYNNSSDGSSISYWGGFGGTSYLFTQTNTPLRFGTNDAERIRILGNGNVGIGITNPGQKLDVSGVIRTNERIIIDKPTGGLGIDITNATDATLKMGVTAAGASSKYGWMGSDVPNQNLVLNHDNGGNVGIGATNPIDKLDVNGDISNYNRSLRLSQEAGFTHIVAGVGKGHKFYTNDGQSQPLTLASDGLATFGGSVRVASNDGSTLAVARNIDLQNKANLSGGNSWTGNGVQNFIGTGDQRSTIQPGIFSNTNTASTAYSALGLYDLTVSAGTNQTSYKNGFINSNVTGTALSFDLPTVSGRLLTGIKTVVTLDFPNVMPNQNAVLQRTVANVAANDVVTIGLPNSLMSTMTNWNGVFQVWVSAANTLSFRFQNNDPLAAHDLPDTTFTIFIHKQ